MKFDRKNRSHNEAGYKLIAAIQAAESEAHRLGLHCTGHALNNAKNAIGWEIAGNIEAAGMAARNDERALVT